VDPAEKKANYWLGWDGARFARRRDGATMAEHSPVLMLRVYRMLLQFDAGADLL
jgi:hypothetical protein